jgi:DNA repair protein RecO (recombination protein O)
LFDEARDALRTLGLTPESTGPRLVRCELVLFRELGYRPVLDRCAVCAAAIAGPPLAFGVAAGGMLCPACQPGQRERQALSPAAWQALRDLAETPEAWQRPFEPAVRGELRQLLNRYVTYLLGHRPRLLPYLGSG